ncbi:MAG: cohesin domain-containing protein [Patescibacteria group bacterium]|nr:cohesin domain-containing protein [Patescibacteria group bacterium]
MKNLPKIISFIFLTIFSFGVSARSVSAAKFYLSPETGSFPSSFSVDVMLNSETDSIEAVDVILTYDTAKLDVLEITSGDFEQYLKKSFNKATGRIEVSALNATAPAGAIAKVAKITFMPLASAITNVDFVYSPGAVDDSNALEKGIESLTSVTGGIYTLALAGSAGIGTTEPSLGIGNTTPVTVGTTVPEVPQTGAMPISFYFFILLSMGVSGAGFALLRTSQK